MKFQRGSICSLSRHEFQEGLYVLDFKRTQIFQESSAKKYVFSRKFYLFVRQTLLSHQTDTNFPSNPYYNLYIPQTHTNFPGASIFSSNRYSFSRKPYLVLEHIRFSRRHLCLEQIHIFQEGTPRQIEISIIGLGVCFRMKIYTQ